MLFKLEHDKDPFVLNEGLKAIKELVALTDRQFTAVALFADYQSPLRTLPEKKRREQAALIAGWPMEGKRLDKNGRNFVDGKVKSMEVAIKKYREIQYDEDREAIERIERQIHENNAAIAEDKEKAATDPETRLVDKKLQYELIKRANDFAKQLPDLHETKTKLQAALNLREESLNLPTFTASDLEGEEFETTGLSTIDLFMSKQVKNNEQED